MPYKLHARAKQMARTCNSLGTYGYTPTRRNRSPYEAALLSLRTGTFVPTMRHLSS